MDDRLFDEFLASTLIGSLTTVIGLMLLVLESRSRGNRATAAAWLGMGIMVATTPLLAGQVDPENVRLIERLYVLPIAATFVFTPAYIRFLADTAHAPARARATVRTASFVASAIGVSFCIVGAIAPARLLNDFFYTLDDVGVLATGAFWLFGGPMVLATSVLVLAWLRISGLEIDPGERSRAIFYGIAVVPLMICMVLPRNASLVTVTASLALSLYAVLIHLAVQGERAAFLSRFLSPQVAELVRLRGLQAVTQPQELQLSVVCIDFRGFTSYTEAIPSQAVIDLISDYHEAIAETVASHEGMIKDYAGDGILILVGAPIARADHQQAAAALARGAQRAAQRVTDRWATGPHPLGVGIGAASGRVTAGAIGQTAQMEYAAVGAPVNLAARLCAVAEDGTILLDERIAACLPTDEVLPRGEISLKGFSHPVAVFELKPDPTSSGQEAFGVAGEPRP